VISKARGFQDVHAFRSLPVGTSHKTTALRDSIRPHTWYVAAVSCEEPIDMEWTLTFTQPDGSQLSFDLQGQRTTYTILVVLLLLLLLAHGYAHQWMWDAPGFGMTRLTSYALATVLLACSAKCVHLHLMNSNGVGSPLLDAIGELMHGAGLLLIAAVFLLVAYGWATLESTLAEPEKVAAVLALLGLSHLVFLVDDWFFLEHASANYAYESLGGIARLVVQLLAARFYLQTSLNSIRGCGDWAKRTFLVRFTAVGAAWFLLLPLTVGIAGLLDHYLRAKAVAIMRLLVDGSVLTLLVFLVNPRNSSVYFKEASLPYSDFTNYAAYDDI